MFKIQTVSHYVMIRNNKTNIIQLQINFASVGAIQKTCKSQACYFAGFEVALYVMERQPGVYYILNYENMSTFYVFIEIFCESDNPARFGAAVA